MMEAVFGNRTDIDSWMLLVRSVSWNFPGLETEESINEHEQTANTTLQIWRVVQLK